MSKAKYYWHGFVKNNVVGRMNRLDMESPLEKSFYDAVIKSVGKTALLNNPKDRLYAIKAICIDKTETVESLALKKYWSERTIRGWTNDFVNLVGEEAGFPLTK